MKKFLLVIIGFVFSLNEVRSQTVPNGDFEAWTNFIAGSYSYDLPDGWNTTDSISLAASLGFVHSAIKETTEVHGGNYAIKLTGWSALGSPVPAAASNGNIDIGTLSIIGGSADTTRHAKLNGFYRYTPVGGDTCYVLATMFKWNSATNMRDTICYGQFTANTASGGTGYSPFTIDFAYNNWTDNPDTMVILLLTSPLKIGSGHVGTTLWIDDLSFTGVVGINEIHSLINTVELYPSPASSVMTVRVDLKKPLTLTYGIYDVQGRQVFADVLEPYETRIDVSRYPAGNYTLNIMDGNQKAYSARFQIRH